MNNELVIYIKKIGKVRISQHLIDKLSRYRQTDENCCESGGVLIGQYLNSNGVLLINNFTPPQKSDIQGRGLYYRSEEHNILVQNIWKESKCHSTYVGLWHTHPETSPNYSKVDRRDWITALMKSKYEGNKLFFFIIGQTHIRCWIGEKKLLFNKIKLVGEYKFGNNDLE